MPIAPKEEVDTIAGGLEGGASFWRSWDVFLHPLKRSLREVRVDEILMKA